MKCNHEKPPYILTAKSSEIPNCLPLVQNINEKFVLSETNSFLPLGFHVVKREEKILVVEIREREKKK